MLLALGTGAPATTVENSHPMAIVPAGVANHITKSLMCITRT